MTRKIPCMRWWISYLAAYARAGSEAASGTSQITTVLAEQILLAQLMCTQYQSWSSEEKKNLNRKLSRATTRKMSWKLKPRGKTGPASSKTFHTSSAILPLVGLVDCSCSLVVWCENSSNSLRSV